MNRRVHIRPRPALAAAILLGGVILYYNLCIPAIHRRGYPLLDPYWMAMPWCWYFPIVLSAAFDRIPPA